VGGKVNPNDIYTAYFNAGQHYAAVIQPYALHLLGLLILMELVTIGITYMMNSDDMPELCWRICRLVFTSGFAYWWLIQAWTLALIVVGSFDQLGQTLSGLSNLTPMHILEQAINLCKVILASPASARLVPDLGAAIEQIALCFMILLAFGLIALLAVVTLVAFYLIVGPGSILIAFLPCRFTATLAENYFTWLVRLGVILMLLYVVLGTAEKFAVQYNATLTSICQPVLAVTPLAALGIVPLDVSSTVCSNPIPVAALLTIAADMLILAGICVSIPFIGAALVNHGINMTLEHFASAKYLASGVARPIARAIAGAGRQMIQHTRSSYQQATLQQRLAAGAAASARIASSQAPPAPAPNAYGVQPTQSFTNGDRSTTKI
jgi:P-type conjugative transfer protein TrbL